jgi:type I restriction enzyme R subunit
MSPYENERKTRKIRVDPKLVAAGWTVVPVVGHSAEEAAVALEEYPTTLGPADYVLADSGDLLAVVEAKKLTLGPQGVLPQAERYAKAIPSADPWQANFGVPFLYATNGEEIWFHDVRHALNRSRRVAAFHSVKAIRETLARDFEAELAKLRTVPTREGIRPYQVEANIAIEQAIEKRQRKMLITMATGTGKVTIQVLTQRSVASMGRR